MTASVIRSQGKLQKESTLPCRSSLPTAAASCTKLSDCFIPPDQVHSPVLTLSRGIQRLNQLSLQACLYQFITTTKSRTAWPRPSSAHHVESKPKPSKTRSALPTLIPSIHLPRVSSSGNALHDDISSQQSLLRPGDPSTSYKSPNNGFHAVLPE